MTESGKKGGCLYAALELYDKQGGGGIFWIGKAGKEDVHHAYFVPPDAEDDQLALNQKDNGYPEYPPFSVGEVKEKGEKQKVAIVREIVNTKRH
jgi:hypothetical protein